MSDLSHFWWQAPAGGGLQIGNSLRFRGAQTLSRAVAGSGTMSVWIKGGTLGTARTIAPNIVFAADNTLNGSTALFRDPSAWMHIVVNNGNTWVNNQRVSGGTAPTSGTLGTSFDGYMAEIHFVDGQALSPTTFGEFNADGVWVPKKVSGVTYGTNGFYLDFSDPANIGADRSGNGNNFTATGFDFTATNPNSGSDWAPDSPTNNVAVDYNLLSASAPLVDFLTPWYWSKPKNYQGWNRQIPTNGLLPKSGKWWLEWGGVWGGALAENIVTGFQTIANAATTNVATFPGYSDAGYGWANPSQSGTSTWWHSGVSANIASTVVAASGAAYKIGFAVDCDQATPTVQLWQNPVNNFADTAGWTKVGDATLSRADVESGLVANASIYYGNLGPRWVSTNPIVDAAGYKTLSAANLPSPALPATITGSFTGNNSADGPFVYTGCVPGRVQYGTIDALYQDRFAQNDVDFLANGFKVRSTTSNSGTVSYTVTTTHTGGEFSGKQVPFGGAGRSPATAISN